MTSNWIVEEIYVSRFAVKGCVARAVNAVFFFFQAEDGIRDYKVTGVQTCALPICHIGYAAGAGYPHVLPCRGGRQRLEPDGAPAGVCGDRGSHNPEAPESLRGRRDRKSVG